MTEESLIDRLRKMAVLAGDDSPIAHLCAEAADEIERLHAFEVEMYLHITGNPP